MRFLVPLDLLAPMLRGEARKVVRPWPADAAPLFAHWSADHGALCFTVHSMQFDPVPPAQPIPLGNGPYSEDQ